MKLEQIFNRLWSDYTSLNESADNIFNLFTEKGENIVNDHIAFRTLDHPLINIDVMARQFTLNGYVPGGDYEFRNKHLTARYFEIPGDITSPRVFISQLKLSECSDFVRKTLVDLVEASDHQRYISDELIFSGGLFSPVSHEIYQKLREESEYAAWFYVFGFRANHFTVSINSLSEYGDIYKVNELLKKNGYRLNSAGGEVKGTPEDLLLQSSTMADIVKINFLEGDFEVPACYYEFAQRLPDTSGQLFNGFIEKSADKIFESTNFYRK